MPELSIVVPSFDQASSLPSVAAELNQICVENSLDVEVIVIDDASEDNTLQVAQELQSIYADLKIRILHRYPPKRGYGAVVRYALAHAVGRFAVVVSAEGGNPVRMIPDMLAQARSGAQLVQCSRYSRQGDDQNVPGLFKFYQTIYRGLIRVLLGRSAPDSTYGFKLFDRVLVMALGVGSNRYNLSPEITFKVLLAGGKVVFVPGGPGVGREDVKKFYLYKELDGYLYIILRAFLHRLGFLWF